MPFRMYIRVLVEYLSNILIANFDPTVTNGLDACLWDLKEL
jgi:hypothetical protein